MISTDNPATLLVLLSVHPRFAEGLLSGSKTVEVRRRHAKLPSGAVALLYATTPRRELVGAVRIAGTDTDQPDLLWERWGPRTGLLRAEFDEYLADRDVACAIMVDRAVRFRSPIPLPELRKRQPGFVTPQSYRFVDKSECAAILNGNGSQLSRLR